MKVEFLYKQYFYRKVKNVTPRPYNDRIVKDDL